jgi:hypothetical protein
MSAPEGKTDVPREPGHSQDGYTWVSGAAPADFRVRWAPGKLSESDPHVVASSTEGEFHPQDGCTWVNPDDPADLSVEKIE